MNLGDWTCFLPVLLPGLFYGLLIIQNCRWLSWPCFKSNHSWNKLLKYWNKARSKHVGDLGSAPLYHPDSIFPLLPAAHSSQLISMGNTTEVTEFVWQGCRWPGSADPALHHFLSRLPPRPGWEPGGDSQSCWPLVCTRPWTSLSASSRWWTLVPPRSPKVMAGLLTGDKTVSYERVPPSASSSWPSSPQEVSSRRHGLCPPCRRVQSLPCAPAAPARACRACSGCLRRSRPPPSAPGLLRPSFPSRRGWALLLDAAPLLARSCSDSYASEMVPFSAVGFNGLFSVLVIFVSLPVCICHHSTRMRSSQGAPGGLRLRCPHRRRRLPRDRHLRALTAQLSHSLGSDQVASVFHATAIPDAEPTGLRPEDQGQRVPSKTAVGKAKSSMGSVF